MSRRSVFIAALSAALFASVPVSAAQPQDGAIDTTFGFLGSGRALIAFDESAASPLDVARAAVAGDDGKSYLVGTVVTNAGAQIGIVRLMPDGSPDPSYGDDGRVVAPAGAIVTGMSAALDDDGFLIVGGTRTVSGSNTDFAVCRFDAEGDLVAFEGNPQNLACVSIGFDIGGDNADVLKDMVIQPDGKIVLAGDAGFSGAFVEAAVARLDRDGTLDTDFSTDGRHIFLGNGFQNHRINAVALDPNGKIVVAGSALGNGLNATEGLVARLTAAGALDVDFSIDGLVTYSLGTRNFVFNDVVTGLSNSAGNRDVFAVGAAETAAGSGLYLGWARRYLGGGSGVNGFGNQGNLFVDGGHTLSYSSIHARPDGKFLLGGTRTASAGDDSDFRVTQMTYGGVVDALSFNFPFGHMTIDITQGNSQDTATAMAFDRGRILVAGAALTAPTPPNLDYAGAALRVDRIFHNSLEMLD